MIAKDAAASLLLLLCMHAPMLLYMRAPIYRRVYVYRVVCLASYISPRAVRAKRHWDLRLIVRAKYIQQVEQSSLISLHARYK